mgnify:CR=1 FL=1
MNKKIFAECERCGEKIYVGDMVCEYLDEFYCSADCVHISVEDAIDFYPAEEDEDFFEEERI